jgi:hypothetical protein
VPRKASAKVAELPPIKRETGAVAKSSEERPAQDQRDRKSVETGPGELPTQERTDAQESETSAEIRDDSTRTLLLGAILGALLVLAIAQLIKRFGLP